MSSTTPRQRITAAVTRDGESPFVTRCVRLLDKPSAVDIALIEDLGGDAAAHVLSGGEGGPTGYWPRTWALRALRYAWDPVAEPAVLAACSDEHWRVREMAAKVIATRMKSAADTAAALNRLMTDDNPRVRAAADRARRTFT